MRKQRCKFIADLREQLEKDDITPQALSDPYADPSTIINKQIKRHDALLDLIHKNLGAQEKILKAVITANAEFADVRAKLMESQEK